VKGLFSHSLKKVVTSATPREITPSANERRRGGNYLTALQKDAELRIKKLEEKLPQIDLLAYDRGGANLVNDEIGNDPDLPITWPILTPAPDKRG
jgi:hypothetical protein